MTSPSGSEQALSLVWVLESVADRSHEDAVEAICEIFGIKPSQWGATAHDGSWFVGDSARHSRSREQIEDAWNQRFAVATGVYLDEDAWHLPLWRLWLKSEKMIFAANLEYLISLRGRGTVVRLAKAVGRSRTTASKWAKWREQDRKVRIPARTVLPKILNFFDLKPTCDLYREPLFLGRAELQDELLRATGKYYLENLHGSHLRQAVERLKEESDRQANRRLLED